MSIRHFSIRALRIGLWLPAALICLATAGFALAGSQPGGNPGGGSVSLQNPIKADNLTDLLDTVLNIIIQIGTPIIVIFILFAGYKYVRAQGNPGKIKEAHQAIMWTLVGTAIVIGAKVIVAIIQSTVNSLK